MKTALIALGLVLGLALAPLGLNVATRLAAGPLTSTVASNSPATAIPKAADNLEASTAIAFKDKLNVITMEETNMVVLRGPVTGSSVGKAIKQLQAVSRRVSKDTPIYLALDTPGGDIVAGTDLIDFAKALPQKVHTITLFAASMGFQIAQNLDTRYIVTNGQLMSHRARVGGLGGQVKGELETRYRMIRRTVDALDYIAAKRMGIDVKSYENMIFNEYWVYGFDAIADKAADEEILVRCGDSLNGPDVVEFDTFFGPVKVTFSKCPLIKEPEDIDFSGVLRANRAEVERSIKKSLLNKKEFVSEYILTPEFERIFR